jgi:DNA polymerase-4
VLEDVADDARAIGRVVVKVRFAPFFTATRGRALRPPTRSSDDLQQAALLAFDSFDDDRAVRLIGVRAEFAEDEPPELA